MIWCDHMYIGKQCRVGHKKMQDRITNGRVHPCVFLIALPQSEHAVLEIIPSMLLLQENYPRDGLRIAGMAATRQEALRLTEQMIAECFRVRQDADVSAYMEQLQTRGCEV
ncbi:MAG: hypothetical protein LUD71_00505 [Clostridiales bacterium]|nr:hypothetical protein [Clostridiales bacterium]